MQDETAKKAPKFKFRKKKNAASFVRYKAILHFELLLKRNQTSNSNVDVQQLTKLIDSIQEKRSALANRKGIIFQHSNKKHHAYFITRQKRFKLDWDMMPHASYSPDLATTDYHFFRSMLNFDLGWLIFIIRILMTLIM